jgi:hypothetical protein
MCWAVAVLAPILARGQEAPRPAPVVVQEATEDEEGRADCASYPLRLAFRVGGGAVLIKAPRGVRPAALTGARDKVRAILADADPAVVERLGAAHLSIIVAPHMGRFVDVPDLRDLAGVRNAFGQPVDLARGVFRPAVPRPERTPVGPGPARPTRHSPLLAVGEEDILRLVPCGPQSALHHEFAHAIHDLGLSAEQRTGWREAYEDARRRGLFRKRYAALNEDEFFAELSQAYFDVAPYFCSKAQLARVDRKAFDRLAEIYSSCPRDRPEGAGDGP